MQQVYLFIGKISFTLLYGITTAILILALCEHFLPAIPKSIDDQTYRAIRLREPRPSFEQIISVTPNMSQNVDLKEMQTFYRTDRNGFILPNPQYKNPDLSICFLGGSTTECLYVAEEKRFHYLVSQKFKEKGFLVNSYNTAYRGNNSLHSINILTNKVVPLRVDIAIMMHNINDITTLLYEETYWNNNPHKSMLINIAQNQTSLFHQTLRLIKNALIPKVYYFLRHPKKLFKDEILSNEQSSESKEYHLIKKVSIDKLQLTKTFSANLNQFILTCKNYGIEPILMTQQSRLKDKPDKTIINQSEIIEKQYGVKYNELKDIFDLFNEEIRQTALKQNVRLIDLAKNIPPESNYLYDTVHLNNAGSELAAEIIFKQILASLPQFQTKESTQI